MPASTLKEIVTIVSLYIPRPLATKVKYDQSNFYKFLIFDTKTNTTICWALSNQLLTKLAVLSIFKLHFICPWYLSFRIKSEQT